MQMNKAKIRLRLNGKSDLLAIFKQRLDKKGYSNWKEFTDKLGIENPRIFIDFFNGKQCISESNIIDAFNELEIPKEIFDIYLERVIKYKIKKV